MGFGGINIILHILTSKPIRKVSRILNENSLMCRRLSKHRQCQQSVRAWGKMNMASEGSVVFTALILYGIQTYPVISLEITHLHCTPIYLPATFSPCSLIPLQVFRRVSLVVLVLHLILASIFGVVSTHLTHLARDKCTSRSW